ncbi:uncharacterized protein LOC126996265 [Eriocheir sinensis]|uniref:uncharacterized protein LOC126996265 n=1 Tax=Eriocheir sinensis TaxID=95602 RepID=UPI0021CAD364|nr:uncharacterized protein LOC126996265 [Eriocheir sinensis]
MHRVRKLEFMGRDRIRVISGTKMLQKDKKVQRSTIPLTKESCKVTAFSTPGGLYQYKALPFGMTISPAAFNKVMREVMRDMAQALLLKPRQDTHPWRATPHLYWKIAPNAFCNEHFSEVWCKWCIVPVTWCAEAKLPDCNKCHPLYWHAKREEAEDNSDYEPEWDTPDSSYDEGNVSSKIVRQSFYNLLTNLKNNNIIKPREGEIKQTPYKEDMNFHLTNDPNHKILHAMLLGARSDHVAYHSPGPNLINPHDEQREIMMHLELPHLTKDDQEMAEAAAQMETETRKTTQKRAAQEDLQEILQDLEEVDWTKPMEGEYRTKTTPNLPTQLRGLPQDRTKWTPGDWKRIKMINKHRSGHSSSAHDQSPRQEEDAPSSPLRITVTTGISHSKASRTTSGLDNDAVDGPERPCITEDDPCPYMNYKRDHRTETQTMKDRDYDFMQSLIQDKQAKTLPDLIQSLSQEEFRTLYITLGSTDIGYWVPQTDSDALKSRTKTFNLVLEIKGYADRANTQFKLDPPPGTIKPADWLAIYDANKENIDKYVRVCEGDRLLVDVHNSVLGCTDSIHWHGIHMKNQQYYDGVPYLTQCPIAGNAFRYDFRPDDSGTYWWHSHSGLNRGEGVFGALVVRQAEDPHRNLYDTDLPEHVMVIHDWGHVPITSKFASRHHSTDDDFVRTILINGKGRNTAIQAEQGVGATPVPLPLEVIKVVSGKRHRLRIISTSVLNCPVVVSVDGHRLTIIATDGSPIKPFATDSFVIYAAERFDVVIEANQTVDNYWIRFNGLIDCQQLQCVQGAVLRYYGAPDQDPTAPLTYTADYPSGVVVNPLNTAGDAPEEVTIAELDALVSSSLSTNVDKKFYLGFDFHRVNNTLIYNPYLYPYNGVGDEWRINSPMINGIAFKHPQSPPLSQPYAETPTLCKYDETPLCEGDFCSCFYVLEVDLHETVEFVLVDEGNVGDENHPFHLHGYNFEVVAIGRIGSMTTVAEVKALDAAGGINRKLENAAKKDTVTIPDGGYVVIRFTADNPGWWLMHCHLLFHNVFGMAAALHVGKPEDLPPVPEGFPTCGDFVPPYD